MTLITLINTLSLVKKAKKMYHYRNKILLLLFLKIFKLKKNIKISR